ncbi:hypothetical protein SF2457T_4055 [Shigella flexneri 2a str. 2457T]|nr:hypothetical protein SF2457T_4055 [Shigella flexneri 2a str. 2457T]
MSCTECLFSFVPEQGISLKVTNGIRQVGDIGGVGFDIVIGSFQLGTVNRILTGG